MKTLQETIDGHFKLNNTYLSDYATKIIDFDDLDLNDICHEISDGSADVIYYSKAHALIADASMDEQSEAQDMINDMGGFGEGKTFDDMACILAYWITYNRMIETLTEEKDSLLTELEEYVDYLTDFIDDLEQKGFTYENSAEYEEISEIRNDTEDFLGTLESL